MRTITNIAILLGFAGSAWAQGIGLERQGGAVAADCRRAATSLSAATPEARRQRALDLLGYCEQSGPPAVAYAWRHPPTSDPELEALVRSSRSLRDERVLAAVIATAKNEGAPTKARFAALQVLANYVDSSVVPRMADLEPHQDSLLLSAGMKYHPGLRRTTHGTTIATGVGQPFDESSKTRILQTLKEIEGTAMDARVQYAAGYLYTNLTRLVDRNGS